MKLLCPVKYQINGKYKRFLKISSCAVSLFLWGFESDFLFLNWVCILTDDENYRCFQLVGFQVGFNAR